MPLWEAGIRDGTHLMLSIKGAESVPVVAVAVAVENSDGVGETVYNPTKTSLRACIREAKTRSTAMKLDSKDAVQISQTLATLPAMYTPQQRVQVFAATGKPGDKMAFPSNLPAYECDLVRGTCISLGMRAEVMTYMHERRWAL
jgi:hypothetical protein